MRVRDTSRQAQNAEPEGGGFWRTQGSTLPECCHASYACK